MTRLASRGVGGHSGRIAFRYRHDDVECVAVLPQALVDRRQVIGGVVGAGDGIHYELGLHGCKRDTFSG